MKNTVKLLGILLVLLILTGCSLENKNESPLDVNNPITISVWHYYNGLVKDKFDSLVTEFNETIGMEQGVVVDAQSYGDVQQLADAVFDSANKTIGAQPMPDIFAAYPDNAFRVNQIVELVDIETYFTKDELSEIRTEFLEEGRFGEDQKLRVVPIAKSTENLYLNKTYWDTFASETGAKLEDLATWEGLLGVAELYYNHTGKAFFGIDANANYMLLASMQLGEELYSYNGSHAELNFSEEVAYKIWENYYIPYIKGYFAKTGRFSSDDAKTGNTLAYTGSTAGASYFPTEVAEQDNVVPIDVITLPYPYFEDGQPYAIQQGAGMCIAKSDEAHEYGAALFLKWFIEQKQNVKFAVSTAYFPVKTEALTEEIIIKELENTEVTNDAIRKSIQTTIKMFGDYTLYGNRPFEGSYEMRKLLENHLFSKVQSDLSLLEKQVSKGEERLEVIESLSSKEQFLQWYEQFSDEAFQILTN